MDGWTLGLLVDYIYTAEIQVTEDNVQVKHTHIYTPPPEIHHLKSNVLIAVKLLLHFSVKTEPLLFSPKYSES